MKVLQLRQKGDDLVRHLADGPRSRQRSVQPGRVPYRQIVQVQHFVFQVEVKLSAQETAQILVNEVVEGVLGSVDSQVLVQIRCVRDGFP